MSDEQMTELCRQLFGVIAREIRNTPKVRYDPRKDTVYFKIEIVPAYQHTIREAQEYFTYNDVKDIAQDILNDFREHVLAQYFEPNKPKEGEDGRDTV